jgi:hypothetical protein
MVRSTRSVNKRQKQESGVDCLTVTPEDATAIISNAIPRISRASRNCKPRCLHFAPSRVEFEDKYPDHFFCTECDNLYQTWVVFGATPRHKVTNRQYLCQANHDNFIWPTQLKPVSHYLINVMDDDNDDDDISIESDYGSDNDNNNNINTTPTTTTTTTTTTQEKY